MSALCQKRTHAVQQNGASEKEKASTEMSKPCRCQRTSSNVHLLRTATQPSIAGRAGLGVDRPQLEGAGLLLVAALDGVDAGVGGHHPGDVLQVGDVEGAEDLALRGRPDRGRLRGPRRPEKVIFWQANGGLH